MRGTVLGINPQSGAGVISGEDGSRYSFSPQNVDGDVALMRAGGQVDFQVDGGNAVSIFPVVAAPTQLGAKSKVVAGLLAIFLGGLGIHKFYLGYTGAGIIMLLCSLFGAILLFIPTFVIGIVALVEGIIYLTKSDQEFYETYEVGKKAWF